MLPCTFLQVTPSHLFPRFSLRCMLPHVASCCLFSSSCRRSHWLCRDYFSLKFFTNYFDQWQTLTCIIMPRLGVYNPSILHRINVSARKKYSKSCTQILNFVTSNPKSPFTFTSGREISDPIEGSVWKSKNIRLSVELSLNCFTFARFHCF